MSDSGLLIHEMETGESAVRDLADIEKAKELAKVLLDHYPGHIWNVDVDSQPSVQRVNIKLNYPDKLGILPKFGYAMRISSATPDRIMRAGGELLERHRLARGRATPYAITDAIKNGCDRAGETR